MANKWVKNRKFRTRSSMDGIYCINYLGMKLEVLLDRGKFTITRYRPLQKGEKND